MAHAPLLRLSASVLRDLQADKEICSLLGPKILKGNALFQVTAENLAPILDLFQLGGFLAEKPIEKLCTV